MNANLASRKLLFRTLAVATTSLALILTGVAPAQADTPTVVDVPDAGFRSCLTKALTRAGLTTDTTANNLSRLTLVSCDSSTGAPISDLTGAEHLSGLDKFFISSSEIADLSPVSGLTGLTQFSLETSKALDTQPLAGLTALYGVGLVGPKITDVSFLSSLNSLDALQLGISPQASLAPVAGVSSLTRFSFNTSESTLPTVTLPTGVTRLSIWAPSLTSLASLPHAPEVSSLLVNNTPALADLTGIANLPGLRTVDLPSAPYSDLTPLSGLSVLENLQAENARIHDLTPLASMTSLTSLDLSGNQITDLSALAGLSNLVKLNLAANRLNNLGALATLPKLTALNVSHNQLTTLGAAAGLAQLTSLDARGNKLTSIDALEGARLTLVSLDHNLLKSITPLSGIAAGATVRLGWNALRDLSPLPDTATVNAYGQQSMHPGMATVGKPFDLGLRDVDGTPICPVFDRKVTCTNGAVNYPLSGTYQGEVSTTGSKLSLSVTQYAGPDRAFAKTYAPSLSGKPTVGRDVGASVRSWSPKVTFTYRWYRDGKAITGATATDSYYRAGVADLGHKLSVCVVGRADGFTPTKRCSTRSKVVRRGTLNRIPRPKVAHSKPVTVGTSLTVKPGRWDTGVRLRYQWLRNGRVIKGATKATYRVRRGDRRSLLTVRVTATKRGYYTERVIAWPHRVR